MKFQNLKACLLAGATAVGALSAVPAFAQDGAGEDAAASGDIIVTARRVEERLQDVPISITVYNQEEITKRNITIATDLATFTPSLSVNERYGPEKASFSLRGFNSDQSTAPTVGVYFAEVVGVRAQGGTTSGNTVGAGSFMDLQNVQVLKGPQGTLFGRNTTGGAILLTPKKPTENLEGYVEGSLGNYDMKRVQAALNIPITDTIRVRAAVDRMKRDGYLKNQPEHALKDFNDRNYFAGRFSVVADLTPDLENYTIFHYSKSDTRGYASRYIGCNLALLPENGFVINSGARLTPGLVGSSSCDQVARHNARGDSLLEVDVAYPGQYLKLEQWQVVNTTTWKVSDDLTVKNIASYGQFREDTSFALYSDNLRVHNPAPVITIPGFPALTPGTAYQYILLDKQNGAHNSSQSTLTEELQVQGNSADGRFNYVVGGYLEFSRPLGFSAGRTGALGQCISPKDLNCTNPVFSLSVSESRTKLNFDNHGIFAQGTFKLTDQLSLTGGIRYTFDKIDGITRGTRLVFDPLNANPASFIDPTSGRRVAIRCTDSFRNPINAAGAALFGDGGKFVSEPSQCETNLKNASNKPTWLVNVDYKFTPDVMAYAKYARGYRQGGINFTNPGVELWKPESVDSYEMGLKTSFRGAVSGYLNIAAFYNKLKDLQVFSGLVSGSPIVSGGAAVLNAGRARIQGIEVDGSATFFDSLRFDLGYTFLDTKVLAVDSIANVGDGTPLGQLLVGTPFIQIRPTVLVNQPFTLSPKHKVTLSGTYTVPIDRSIGKLSLGATFIYTAKQTANASVPASCGPTAPLGQCFSTTNFPLGALPSHSTVNLNVNWDGVGGSPVDAAFFVTNVGNKIYPVNTGGGFSSGGMGDLLFGEPRMWGFRLRYNFSN